MDPDRNDSIELSTLPTSNTSDNLSTSSVSPGNAPEQDQGAGPSPGATQSEGRVPSEISSLDLSLAAASGVPPTPTSAGSMSVLAGPLPPVMEMPEPATTKPSLPEDPQVRKPSIRLPGSPTADAPLPAESHGALPSTERSNSLKSRSWSTADDQDVEPLDKGKAAMTEPPVPVDGPDAEPSIAGMENVPRSGHLAQPRSSSDGKATLGHSAQPSSSTNTTSGYGQRTPHTRQTSKTSVSSDEYKGFQCGCRMTGEGKDRRQLYCAVHNPYLEETLQSALENTGPPTPELPSDNSDTDPGPHLQYLHAGSTPSLPNMHHAPVVSADPATYEENRQSQPLSPPPGYEDSDPLRNLRQLRELSSQIGTGALFGPSLDAIPRTQGTTQHIEESTSTAGANPTIHVTPPSFTEAVQPTGLPSYMGFSPGDGHVAGQSSENVARGVRNRRMMTGETVMGDWPSCCGDCPCGSRCCGNLVENIRDVCIVM